MKIAFFLSMLLICTSFASAQEVGVRFGDVSGGNVAVDAVLAHIRAAMLNGGEVRIPDFGTFKVTKRKAREGRNPSTGQTIQIPASKVPKFTPAKGLKDALN